MYSESNGAGTDTIEAFGMLDGGVLCAKCRAGRKQVVSVSAGALKTLEQLADYSFDRDR